MIGLDRVVRFRQTVYTPTAQAILIKANQGLSKIKDHYKSSKFNQFHFYQKQIQQSSGGHFRKKSFVA